ncbi:MAG: cupin domain-containing protein [Bacteroidales bacterium]|nr:cupin domain-containing protein [Bacteroidales bacterium]
MYDKEYWIEKLGLLSHPEGGFFKEIYRSPEMISKKCLPGRYSSFRPYSTSIYFMITSDRFSAFHRVKSDEIWHFYTGSPLTLHILHPTGKLFSRILGPGFHEDQVFQLAIPKGCWFAAEIQEVNGFTLVGCTVSPGFDFDDFEMAEKEKLLHWYPAHKAIIERLCRET